MDVAIIGNGDLLTDHSARIDACDYVIRINMVRGIGGNYGDKMDYLVLCNTGVAAVTVMSPKHNRNIAKAKRIILARNPALYTDIGAQFMGQRAAEFFVDFSHVATGPGFKHARVDCVDYEVGLAIMTKLTKFSQEPFVMPSTGMRVIEEVIENPQTFGFAGPISQIFVAGFTYEGWPGHPWNAERALTDHYIAQGLVTRLT